MKLIKKGFLWLFRFCKRYKPWIFVTAVTIPFVILFINTWSEADPNTRFGVVAALIGLIGTVAGASATHHYTKRRDIEARHFAEKRKAYGEFINLFFGMAGHGKKLNQHQMQTSMLEFKKALLIWGSDDFLKLWNLIEVNPQGEAANTEALRRLDEVLRRIRIDLGHDDKALRVGDLADYLLVAKDRGKLKDL